MIRMRRFMPILALAAACGGSPEPAPPPAGSSVVEDGVRYTADTRVLESFPVQIHTTVTLRNEAGGTRTVELGSGCPVLLRAYRSEARGAPAWDQGRGLACTLQIQQVELAPADTAQRTTRTDAREILGDSLPDGRYWLDAYVRVVSGEVVVPAGAVELAVPR